MMAALSVLTKRPQLSLMNKMALWQAPLIFILSLEIGWFMWGFWLAAWMMSSVRRWWLQMPILALLVALVGQMVPVRSADFFILMLVILLPFSWRLPDAGKQSSDEMSLSPAGLCPTIFVAGSVFIFQSQFIVLLGLVAWLLSFLLWFATALTGFRLASLSVRWLPILGGSALTAIVIVLLFTTIPRLSTGFIPSFATATQQIGLTDELSPGGMSDLLASEDIAFRAIPASIQQPAPSYWRVFVLSEQRGNSWYRAKDRSKQNDFILDDNASLVRYQILTDTHDLSHIPMAGWAGSSAKASLSGYHFNRFGEASLSEGQDSRQIEIISRDGDFHEYQYPAKTALSQANPRLQSYGKKLRQAYQDEGAFIAAVMRKFGDEFLYDTQVSYPDENALDQFFFETKIGYCSYFATTLATILRAGGLEAHVITGYMGGDWNSFGDYWLVNQSDAHAWVEVRLSDGRWHRLDPTLEAMQLSTARFQGLADFGETEFGGREIRRDQDAQEIDRLALTLAFLDSLNLRVTLAIMNYGDDTPSDRGTAKSEDNFALLLAVIGLAVTMVFAIIGVMRLSSLRQDKRPESERKLERLLSRYVPARLSGESLIEHAQKCYELDAQASQLAVSLADEIYAARFGTNSSMSPREVKLALAKIKAKLQAAKKAVRL